MHGWPTSGINILFNELFITDGRGRSTGAAYICQQNALLPVFLHAPADGSLESLLYQALGHPIQSFPGAPGLLLTQQRHAWSKSIGRSKSITFLAILLARHNLALGVSTTDDRKER